MAPAVSPELQVDSLPLSHQGSTGKQYIDPPPKKKLQLSNDTGMLALDIHPKEMKSPFITITIGSLR